MDCLMPPEMLLSEKASPAMAQMALARGGPHLLPESGSIERSREI